MHRGVLVWRDVSLKPTSPHTKAQPTTRVSSTAAQVRCRPVLSNVKAGEGWGQLCSALGHQHSLRWQPRLGMSECLWWFPGLWRSAQTTAASWPWVQTWSSEAELARTLPDSDGSSYLAVSQHPHVSSFFAAISPAWVPRVPLLL